MTFEPLPSKFPYMYVYEENLIFFFISMEELTLCKIFMLEVSETLGLWLELAICAAYIGIGGIKIEDEPRH